MINPKPLTIHVIGRSGSGKTTAIEYLTTHLTRLGFSVGVIKHVHREGFTFDAAGKDTWRHARAGASVVAGVSPRELAIFKPTRQETALTEVFQTLQSNNLNLILVEGFSRAPSTKHSLKILAAKNVRELKQILKLNKPPIIAITGPVASSKGGKTLRDTPAPIIDIQADQGRLVATVRKRLRPNELRQLYRKAALNHGSECIGLAIGIRAAYLASNILGRLETKPKLRYGTKRCVAEAFTTVFPGIKAIPQRHRDELKIENPKSSLIIQLAPKKQFRSSAEALSSTDDTLFKSIHFST